MAVQVPLCGIQITKNTLMLHVFITLVESIPS